MTSASVLVNWSNLLAPHSTRNSPSVQKKADVAFLSVALLSVAICGGADWPMYRGDAARTACSPVSLSTPLGLAWTHQAPHKPEPAWPRGPRMQFDRVFHVVAAQGRVLYGNSVDGTVTALDWQTGEVVWQYPTNGPVRFAPAVWRDRAFATSDDGYLYALRLSDGHLLWKRRGGPGDALVLGNGKVISKWPARGGAVVADDRVYFAAGIWPTDGIFLYALDAESGDVLWCNSDSGAIYMPQPHPGAESRSGVSAQGYLVVSGDQLLVPTGRAVPACFDRATGQFRYFHLQKYGHNGEAPVMAVGDVFFNGGLSFNRANGVKIAPVGTGALAATRGGVIRAAGDQLGEYRWQQRNSFDRKGKRIVVRSLEPAWQREGIPEAAAVLVAGDRIFLGGQGLVCGFDIPERRVTWQAPVDGTALGLAATEDRLLVSTTEGRVYCFAAGVENRGRETQVPVPQIAAEPHSAVARAAEEIIRSSGVREGYCVDLACGDGALAAALAQRTDLFVIAVDPEARNCRVARRRLQRAGLYGSRACVLQSDSSATRLPAYIADLVVSQDSVVAGGNGFPAGEAERLQRPWGGVVCVGKSGAMEVFRRGALPGGGSWTHQYADAANTSNSQDELVRGQLTMHWFRDVDLQLAQRHGRPPAPLFAEGRLFHEGIDGLIAVNAYNGRTLWRFEIPQVLKAYDGDELMGAAGTGSNYCVGGDSVYVRHEDRCFRLDARSGQVLGRFQTPAAGNHKPWGYIAWSDGTLFGSEANDEHIVTYRYLNRGGDMTKLLTESQALFALDPDSGAARWRYAARHSIRHNAIAVADQRVVLIDRPLATFDRVKRPPTKEHPTGILIALDAANGERLWQNDQDIYGTVLAISAAHRVVLMSYQPTRFRLDSEFGGRLAAFRLDDGSRLWDIEAAYVSRPLINGRTIYAQGGAWDLLTGESVPFEFRRSYGCGILSCSRHMLFFRSATLGYYDFSGASKTRDYGGMRPGCWINTLPVGGLVLVPDATAGCECSYLNRAWVGLSPIPVNAGNGGAR